MTPLVFLTDFGTDDGAVSAMYGVAYGVDPELNISDLTHGITPYDVWEARLRVSSIIRTASMPNLRRTWVSVPLSGVTIS